MNAKSSALSLLSLSFGLVACEPVVDACEAAATHEAAVEFGVGENQLRLVEDGDLVTFHSGFQGGQHIYGGVLTQGMVPGHDPLLGGVQDGVELTFTLMVDDIEFGWGGRTDVALDGDAASSRRMEKWCTSSFGTSLIRWMKKRRPSMTISTTTRIHSMRPSRWMWSTVVAHPPV